MRGHPALTAHPVTSLTPVRTVVVLPTYNERENVTALLTAVRRAVPGADLLVVDDNSPDGTAALVEAAASDLGQIKLVGRARKQGLGTAYREGFAIALDEGYDVVVSMDVDFSHDPAVLPDLLAVIDAGADVVIGSRYVPGGATVDWPVHRRLLSRWGNRYTSFVLGLGVRDCTTGYRAHRATALREIEPATTTAEGYAFLTELVRRHVRHGHDLRETPIVFRDRRDGTSKMSTRIVAESMLKVTGWGVRDLAARTSRERWRGECPSDRAAASLDGHVGRVRREAPPDTASERSERAQRDSERTVTQGSSRAFVPQRAWMVMSGGCAARRRPTRRASEAIEPSVTRAEVTGEFPSVRAAASLDGHVGRVRRQAPPDRRASAASEPSVTGWRRTRRRAP